MAQTTNKPNHRLKLVSNGNADSKPTIHVVSELKKPNMEMHLDVAHKTADTDVCTCHSVCYCVGVGSCSCDRVCSCDEVCAKDPACSCVGYTCSCVGYCGSYCMVCSRYCVCQYNNPPCECNIICVGY